MAHLADLIEEFILRKLSGNWQEATILKRNELAEELNCAPSQISYVLSTRFTIERGFIVESRRGSGGFVRIVRVPMQFVVYETGAEEPTNDAEDLSLEEVIDNLHRQGMLSNREAEIMRHFFLSVENQLSVHARLDLFRKLLLRLADFS